MQEKIFKIVKGLTSSEPIYKLESEYKSIIDEDKRKEFLSIIKFLALNGSTNEKFISLSTIEFLNKADECSDVIKKIVEEIKSFEKNAKLIPPLLSLCAMLSTDWAIDFIKETIKHFNQVSNEGSYIYNIGIRSIASTHHWEEIIDEINWILNNNDDNYIVDFLAYFIWTRGEDEFKKLIEKVSIDYNIKVKIKNIEIKIYDRFINNYSKISF